MLRSKETMIKLLLALTALALLLPACAPSPDNGIRAGAGGDIPGGASLLNYGMQVDPGDDYQRALGLVKDAGFGWAKAQLRWEDLQPQPDLIHWNVIDDVVNGANARGVKLLLSVTTAPKWARPQSGDFSVPGPPAKAEDFANFLSAIATRHKGKIGAIEVWNEQNLWYEWGGQGKLDAADYVAMLKVVYGAIKAADPNVLVISGALTPTGVDDGKVAIDDVRYMDLMYQAGLKDYCDAIGAHPGGYNNPPDDTPAQKTVSSTTFKGHWSFYYLRFEQYYEVMQRYGDGQKKLWFTEFGWASSANPPKGYEYAKDNTEQDQANYLVRAFQIAKQKGYVGAMFVWNLNFAPGAGADDPVAKASFGILRTDWSPRPAYDALKAMQK